MAPGGVLHAGAEKRQHATADIGPYDQANGHRQADHTCARQCGREQHGGQARVGNHGEQGADQRIEQDIARQRGENHFDALGLSDGGGGFDDQLQGQNDQAQADAHPAQLARAGLLARQEKNHPEKNQQRRQPRQVKSQHPRHQRRADIRPEHRGQGWRQCHQALANKRGDQHRGGVAALHHGRHHDPGDKRQHAFGHVLPNHMAQV